MSISGLNLFSHQTTHLEEKPASDVPEKRTNRPTDNLAGSPQTGHKNKFIETGKKKLLSLFKRGNATKIYPDNSLAAKGNAAKIYPDNSLAAKGNATKTYADNPPAGKGGPAKKYRANLLAGLHWEDAKAHPENLAKGPVFKSADQSINKEFLKSLVVNLDNALPELPLGIPKKPNATPKVSEKFSIQKENLSTAFFNIYASVSPWSPRFSPNHNPCVTKGELALVVRDEFAKAAKSAKKLAAALRKEGYMTKAKKYAALAELCVELKRGHLAAGARHILDEFTQQEVKKIEEVAPGLNRAESGAIIEKTKGASFWVTGGRLLKLKLGGGFSKTDTLKVDDDKDLNYWTLYNGHFKVGVKETLRKIFTDSKGASVTGKIGATFGPTYKETATLPEMIKMMTVREAENSFFRSAGPRRRAWDRWMRRLEKSMGSPSRIMQRSANIPLYLSQRKVMKGAFNQDIMARFAEEFDGDKNGALTTLIKSAHPSATTSLQANETHVSPMAYVPRPSEPAGATGLRPGREGWAYKAVDISGEFKDQIATPTPVGGKLSATMEAGGEIRQFGLERLKGSHAFLDVAYNKDREEPIRLFKDMENAENHDDRLHLYREVNDLISSGNAGNVKADPKSTWPAAFLKTRTCQKPQEALAKVEKACALLEKKYLQLIDAAPKLRAARSHSRVGNLQGDIKAAFETISREIWDGQHPSGSRKPHQPPKKTNQITTLLAQSYDAASLALGAIGLHLTILKNETLAKSHSNDHGDLTKSIAKANLAYKRVRELLDGVSLPISHDQLMRHSTIASPGISRKKEIKVGLRLRGGVKLNPMMGLAKKLSKIPVLNWLDLGGGSMSVQVNNGLGTAFVDLGAKYTYSEHPNLGRGGHFIDINVTGGVQAPFLKEAMEKIPALLEKLIKKANPKNAGDDKNIRKTIEKKLGPWMKTLAKETYMEGGSGITGMQIRFHAFPNTFGSSKTLGFGLQYMRFTKEEVLTVNGTVTARNGGIENLGGEVNIQTGQKTATPRFEYMGGDLAYHVLQFSGLEKILNSASTPEERKKLLDENPFVKSQFFSTEAILKIVKSHAKFLKSIDKGAVKKHYGFYMYHNKNYKEFLKSAAEQAFYAGTGDVDPKNKPESIYDRMTKNYASDDAIWHAEATLWQDLYLRRAGISPMTGQRIHDMAESEKPSEVDVRADYFLKNPDGQKILDAYCNIMRTYREANASLMVNEGYQLKLREPGTVKKTVGGQPDKSKFAESEFDTETEYDTESTTEYDSESEYDTESEFASDTEFEYDMKYESLPGGQMHETPVLATAPKIPLPETAPETIFKAGGENKKNHSETSENAMRSQLVRMGKQSKLASSKSASSSDSSVALIEKPSTSRSSKRDGLLKFFGKKSAKENGFKKSAAGSMTAALLPR